MKIGFIGAGNMAAAMIRGMVQSGFAKPEDIYVYDVSNEAAQALCATTPVQVSITPYQVVEETEMIIFAVKPQVIGTVLSSLGPVLLQQGGKLVVSIAAGVSLDALSGFIGGEVPMVRVMPNVNMMVSAAMSAVCPNRNATNEQVESVLALLRSVGQAVVIPEKDMAIFTAIAGCSPSYTCLFIDSLARAAVRHGLSKQAATAIAAQAVLGSGKMVLESDKSPSDLIDMVCSPAGTTIAGLLAMQEHGFQAAVTHGVDAAVARDKELQ